jgi:hypothetical protein
MLRDSNETFNTVKDCMNDAQRMYADIVCLKRIVLTVQECHQVVNPLFSTYAERVKSFETNGWPPLMPLSAEEMAKAGFFYSGFSDKVTCFECGVTLKKWISTDTALGEHKRHSQSCLYLSMCM